MALRIQVENTIKEVEMLKTRLGRYEDVEIKTNIIRRAEKYEEMKTNIIRCRGKYEEEMKTNIISRHVSSN